MTLNHPLPAFINCQFTQIQHSGGGWMTGGVGGGFLLVRSSTEKSRAGAWVCCLDTRSELMSSAEPSGSTEEQWDVAEMASEPARRCHQSRDSGFRADGCSCVSFPFNRERWKGFRLTQLTCLWTEKLFQMQPTKTCHPSPMWEGQDRNSDLCELTF